MEAFVLELVILLLSACSIAVFAEYMGFPYTSALVLFGLAISVFHALPEITLTREVLFYLILPPLLFEGALEMDLDSLKRNFQLLAVLATAGVLVSALVSAVVLKSSFSYLGLEIPFFEALLFGTVVSPTDPVSVLATFKKSNASKKLTALLEGESILNDGTAVVLFTILMSGNNFQPVDLLKFFEISAGGALVGAAMGYIFYVVLKRIDDHLIEVTLTIVLAYLSLIVAEEIGLSGVMAVVAAGLLMGNRGSFAMSERTREVLNNFWGVAVFLINSLVFIAVGMDIAPRLRFSYVELIAVVASLIGRAVAVYPALWFFELERLGKLRVEIDKGQSHLLFWAGLKGTIPVALALSLSKSYPLVAELTLAVVLFSLVFQAASIELIARKMLKTAS